MLKLIPLNTDPIFLLFKTLSAPFPKGRMEIPSEPIPTLDAKSFISSYVRFSPTILLSQAFKIPVPLIQSSTPNRGFSTLWFTWANVFTLD